MSSERLGSGETASPLEYAVRRVPSYRLLARACPPDPAQVQALLLELAADIAAGVVHSDQRGIAGIAVFLAADLPPRFAAGVPVEPTREAEVEGYAVLDVPAGRYAMITLPGAFEQIASLFGALFEAVLARGERATGETITVYREPTVAGEPLTELGVRLAS